MEELRLALTLTGLGSSENHVRPHASIAPMVEAAGTATPEGDDVEGGADLVSSAYASPAAAFAVFYEAEFDGAVRLAKALTGSWEVARDVAQDAFCAMHRQWHRVEQPHAYLRRSVVNGSTSVLRRRRRDAARPVPLSEPVGLGADELSDAVAALPPRQRAAIVLRHHLDLPDAEIADALGVRVGTVASLVHRGLAQLRVALADQPETSSETSIPTGRTP